MFVEVLEGVDLCCKHCHKDFWVCRSCYRGHRYCSEKCRGIGRKESQKTSKLKYEQSPEAREDHRDRQEAYRNRLKQLRNNQQSLVTEHSSRTVQFSVEAISEMKIENKSVEYCSCCGSRRLCVDRGES